MIIIVDR